MLIETRKYLTPWIIFFGFGIMIVVLTLLLKELLLYTGFPILFAQIRDFLIGFYIMAGISLVLFERSRFSGILILITAIPLTFYFLYIEQHINPESLYNGIIIGTFVSAILIYKIKAEMLANIVRILVTAFLVMFIGYLVWAFLFTPKFQELFFTNNIYFGMLLIVTTGFWYYLFFNLWGETSSDIIIFGDTGSGKSYFLAAMFTYLKDAKLIKNDEKFLLSPNDQQANYELDINTLSEKLRNGHFIRGTHINEFVVYSFHCKKWGLIPMTITVIDYAGARVRNLTKDNYKNALAHIAPQFDTTPERLENDLLDLSYLNMLKEKYFSSLVISINEVVTALIYRRMMHAGKIIFLIDGDNLKDLTQPLPSIDAQINPITDLMKTMGEHKSYAFSITKADIILNYGQKVRDANERSTEAKSIIIEIFKKLIDNNRAFKALYEDVGIGKLLKSYYIESFLVSVDSSRREDNAGITYHPWRIFEIVDYVMKF